MKKTSQISESIELGIILALCGGFMDAYSYIQRGEVFANAQTGNMLLMGVYFSEGDFQKAISYLIPVLSFAIGIAFADIVRMLHMNRFHWRQISVFIEALILMGVSFIPESMNLMANSLTSLACGIQVESFRKIHGNGIATTMCIGNLRSATQNLCYYFKEKDKNYKEKSIIYYGIILCFILGAVLGNIMVRNFHEKAIIVCSILLIFSFILMFIDREHKNLF